MSLRLYLDVHSRRRSRRPFGRQGVDVLTAQEDGSRRFLDPALLDRALALNRVLFTRDEDFLGEGSRRQQAGAAFAGIIYAHQIRVTIGQCVRDLELMAKVLEPEDFVGRIEHLPLK